MKSKQHLLETIARAEPDRRKYLTELFKYLPEAIAVEISYAEVRKNEYLLLAGDTSNTVYIILTGHVIGLDHQKMGRMYSFMDFTKMYIVGDFEIFADCSEYGVSIRTTEDCKLLKISAGSYLRWIQHDENALFLRLKNILATLTFERKIDRKYLLMGCKERLINFLLRLYEKEDKPGFGRLRVEMTQAELADKIGFNTRSVQRSIASLEAEDMVSNENGKIVVFREQYLKLKQYETEKERGNRNGKV